MKYDVWRWCMNWGWDDINDDVWNEAKMMIYEDDAWSEAEMMMMMMMYEGDA